MAEQSDQSLVCRAAIKLAPNAAESNEIVYLPQGLHEITPIAGGIGKPIKVLVDRAAAVETEKRRLAIIASGKRPYFDLNHDDREASFWPNSFFWREGEGVIAAGEWSGSGKRSVAEKDFYAFSPVFHVDNKHANPARIAAREEPKPKPNMGGLVNDPAFDNLPLWAKNAGGSGEPVNKDKENYMDKNEIADLRAKNQELQKQVEELTVLVAKDKNDQVSAARLAQAKAELETGELKLKAAELETKNSQQAETIKARNKADAETVVKAAVERGAILPKDTKTQEALVARATEDPGFVDVIKAMQGNPALEGRITRSANSGDPKVTKEAPNAVIKAFYGILAKNAALKLTKETSKEKGALAREAAAIFAKDIEKDDVLSMMPIEEAIKAADVADVQVGLLAGTLVLQRALPLLQFKYPVLGAITTDFSDEPALYQQTEVTRIIVKPAVQTYDATLDSAGRPKGWTTVSPAQSVDIPITLDEYVGVPIVFGVTTLAKTIRRLFDEQAPQALYALGGYFVKKLAALFTSGNYNAYAATSVGTGATTTGSEAASASSTANMYPGQAISGTGIPANTYIASITDSTNFKMTQKATATNSGLTFTLGPGFDDGGTVLPIPTTYATYAEALADFNMASLGKIGAAFDSAMVPDEDRAVLLNAAYFSRLAADPSFNTFFAAMRNPEIITDRQLPRLQGFNPISAPWFPSSSNRVGIAFSRAFAAVKSRLPQDFTQAVGAMVPGSVTTVSAPGGFSVLLVQYVNLTGNYAEWRPEVMIGAALGDRRCGLVLTSQ
jgi:phage I-like protein